MWTLSEPNGMGQSSAQPGVSGESSNASYGPKAADVCPISEVMNEVESYRSGNNEKYREASADDDCFDTHIDKKMTQNSMGESSLRP
jgi:hypothetical protein